MFVYTFSGRLLEWCGGWSLVRDGLAWGVEKQRPARGRSRPVVVVVDIAVRGRMELIGRWCPISGLGWATSVTARLSGDLNVHR